MRSSLPGMAGWWSGLLAAIGPDHETGEDAELPRYESGRGPGSTAEVDFETRREPCPVLKSHVNAVVPDTARWEQSAAWRLDTHEQVRSFVKNANLGFAIPYQLCRDGDYGAFITSSE